MPVRPTRQSSQLSARRSSQEMMNYKNWTRKRTTALHCCPVPASKTGNVKEYFHWNVARSWEEKADLKKEQLHCMSCPDPASQNRTCKKIIALQCCKVLGRKTGHTKRQLQFSVSGPGKQIHTCKRATKLHCYLLPASKTSHVKEKLHLAMPVPAHTSRTCRG